VTREEAWELLCRWVQSPALRRHLLGVEAAMRACARRYGGDPDLWGLAGLLHDLDYERHPSQEAGHPYRGAEALQAAGAPREVVRAVLAHADYTGVTRETLMEKALFACDELVGFLVAVALSRPGRTIAEVDLPAVLKKLKEKAFARGVNREELRRGAAELGVPFEEHIQVVLDALQAEAPALGLAGEASVPPGSD
jgi:putative nucleotidyltransferase with HDIG domain